MVQVVVGPVIGKVTDSTARILIEVDEDATLILKVHPEDSEEKGVLEVSACFSRNIPGVWTLEGLTPSTKYKCTLLGADNAAERNEFFSLRTWKTAPDATRLVFASCDRGIKYRGKANLFEILYDDFVSKDKVDLIVRHGDQVYADHAFEEGIKILKEKRLSSEEKEEKIYEAYAKHYRDTWDQPDVRKVLGTCSHLMLLDDHEIRNDWGTKSHDRDPKCNDYLVARMARKAYWFYQRQLWGDVNHLPEDASEHSSHVWGNLGIVCIERRLEVTMGPGRMTPKTSHKNFLGESQWESLEFQLFEGSLSTVKNLVVVQSSPYALMGTTTSSFLKLIPPQLDKVGFGTHPREQAEYMHMLKRWKKSQEGRQLFLIGGDLHYGLETEIFQDEESICMQLISSAISNNPPPKTLFAFLKTVLKSKQKINAEFHFMHKKFLNRRNFLQLQFREGSPAKYHFVTGAEDDEDEPETKGLGSTRDD